MRNMKRFNRFIKILCKAAVKRWDFLAEGMCTSLRRGSVTLCIAENTS